MLAVAPPVSPTVGQKIWKKSFEDVKKKYLRYNYVADYKTAFNEHPGKHGNVSLSVKQ